MSVPYKEIYAKAMDAVVLYRRIADDPDIVEGELRDSLRQAAHVVEVAFESHRSQHELIIELRRVVWCVMVLAAAAVGMLISKLS